MSGPAHLRRLGDEGSRGATATAAARRAATARLADELAMIERMGFTDYFLLVAEIVGFARARTSQPWAAARAPARSWPTSLGITNVDPIRYGLAFERFLNPRARDCPDLDIDLCWKRRDEVIAHVYQTYGDDRVAMISTHATLGARSAFRETAKALGVPNSARQRARAPHPARPREALPRAARRARPRPASSTGASRRSPAPWRSPSASTASLRHLSIHCGGVVIGDRPLTYYVPLERAAKNIIVTQFEMRADRGHRPGQDGPARQPRA